VLLAVRPSASFGQNVRSDFVIDPKNWRGTLTLRARGPMTRLESRLLMDGRDRTDKLTRVSHHAALIREALALSGLENEPEVTPVVCFVNGAASLVSAPKSFGDVAIVRPGGLARLIESRRDAPPADIDLWFDYLGRVRADGRGEAVRPRPRGILGRTRGVHRDEVRGLADLT
jgi:hypothetical protein